MAKKKIVSRSRRVDPNKVGKRAERGKKPVYQGTFEAEWSCTSCGREHIPGSEKICPACSNPRETEEAYQQPEERGAYMTQAELQESGVDPTQHLSDESCRYCQAKIKPGAQNCPNCGANLVDTAYTARQCPACGRETNAELCPDCGTATELKGSKPAVIRAAASAKPKQRFPLGIMAGGIGFTVLACIALIVLLVLPKNIEAGVTARSWTRTIVVQEHQYNPHEGWDVPAGADVTGSEVRVHHHDQVLIGTVEECHWESQRTGYDQQCGYEESCQSVSVYDYTETICYDDGTCDDTDHYRDEQDCSQVYACEDVARYEDVEVCSDVPQYQDVPVSQDWYFFNHWEWVAVTSLQTSGAETPLIWPEFVADDTHREAPAGRSEICTVTFETEKGDLLQFEPTCSELDRYAEGSQWTLRVSDDEIVEIEALQ